jgi:putative transposase
MERYRITADAHVYYVTYSIIDWLPIFISEAACKIVTDSFAYCHREKSLRINAFVVMPTHVHAIVFDADFDNGRLEKTLAEFRKFTGRQLTDHCAKHAPPCFSAEFREQAGTDRDRRLWQPSRHPVEIVSEKFWRQKLDYLHDNPVRKGLVTDPAYWRFSSARWHDSDGMEQADAPLTFIEW